ncbi:MAG: hypothetical protein R6W87_11310, partial [Halospina sp.]
MAFNGLPAHGCLRTREPVYYELDRYDEADFYFDTATEMEPEFADRYSYLSARVGGSTARASAAMD